MADIIMRLQTMRTALLRFSLGQSSKMRINFTASLLESGYCQTNSSLVFSQQALNKHTSCELQLISRQKSTTLTHSAKTTDIQSRCKSWLCGHSNSFAPCVSKVTQARQNSKTAKKKKGSNKKSNVKEKQSLGEFSDEDMPASAEELVDMAKFKGMLRSHVDQLKKDYIDKLSLRTSLSTFNNFSVTVDKNKTQPLQYLGQITLKGAQTVIVNMTSNPQYISVVKDALVNSSLNINPRVDGTTIYIEIPHVTREHREKMSKSAKILCDAAKVKVRNEQNSAVHLLRAADKLFSRDNLKLIEKEIMQATKEYNKELEKIMKDKQTELLGNQKY